MTKQKLSLNMIVGMTIMLLATNCSCKKPTVDPPTPPLSTITISVSSTSVEYGDTVIVSWVASSNSKHVYINGEERSSLKGSFSTAPLTVSSVTFTGTSENSEGKTTTDSKTVTVAPMSTEMSLLTGLGWHWTKEEEEQPGGGLSELTLSTCVPDDLHIFYIDKKFKLQRGNVPCGSTEENIDGTWKLLNNNTQLVRLQDSPMDIISISAKKMFLRQEVPKIGGGKSILFHTYTR